MNRTRRTTSLSLTLWILTIACSFLAIFFLHMQRELTRNTAPPAGSFSRDLPLGLMDVNSAPALDAPGGGAAVIAWPESHGITAARVSTGATVEVLKRTDLRDAQARDLNLARDLVAWRDERDGGLSVARLDGKSLQIIGPKRVLDNVMEYTLLASQSQEKSPIGYILAAIPDRVELLALDASGARQLASPAVNNVISLDAVRSSDGGLHAAFLERDGGFRYSIKYSVFREETGWSPPAMVGYASALGSHTSLRGIRLGLDETHVYFFFGADTRRPYQTAVFYAVEPLRGPITQVVPTRLAVTGFPAIQMLGDPMPQRTQARDLLVSVVATVSRADSATGTEALITRFKAGKLVGADLASRTSGAVLQPRIARGPSGTVVSFLETDGFGRYLVRATADTPGFRERLNRPTVKDRLSAASDALLSLFFVFGLMVYVGATWVPAFMWLVASSFVAMTWTERNPGPVLAVALSVYGLGKVWMVLTNFYSGTFRAGMPAWLGNPGTGLLLCAATLSLAVWGVAARWRRERRGAPFGEMAFAAAIDTALTLALYAPFIH